MRSILIRMMEQGQAGRPAGQQPLSMTAPPAEEGKPRRATSDELLGQAGELIIVHGEREYRLRRTANGKLILTA
jgi:hemin uptake protein HemP